MPSLLTELRRRNVFSVGATCAKMGRLRRKVNVGYVCFLAESGHSRESYSPQNP